MAVNDTFIGMMLVDVLTFTEGSKTKTLDTSQDPRPKEQRIKL